MSPIDINAPVVLSFSCNDPTGGSGLAADIETFCSLGCHCTPIITAISARDTQGMVDSWAIESPIVIQQARAILEDINIAAIKVGSLGSVENIEAIHTILRDYADMPVILDPDFRIGSDHSDDLIDATRTLLLAQSNVTVLDIHRLRQLTPSADSLSASAQAVIESGSEYVLACGLLQDQNVTDILYAETGIMKEFVRKRQRQTFVGESCTYSAALTAFLAHQDQLLSAVEQAQNFCCNALSEGTRLGMGDLIPNRFFWSKGS